MAIDNFTVYLRGHRFTLYTDHKPLETLSTVQTKTLNWLQQQLLEFNFDIRYKVGKANMAADALSRNTMAALNNVSGTLRQAKTADAYRNSSSSDASQAHQKGQNRLGKQALLADGLVWHILKQNKQRTQNVIQHQN